MNIWGSGKNSSRLRSIRESKKAMFFIRPEKNLINDKITSQIDTVIGSSKVI
jgi:hypothetical protein